MLKRTELLKLAGARLEDAKILLDAGRSEAAAYLCGYVMELALKAKICQTLRWATFPETHKEFLQMTCEMVQKSITSKRFRRLYDIPLQDFCKVYEKHFQNPKFLKSHDLSTLLKFSGVADKIKTQFFTEWSTVSQWTPEDRYQPVGLQTFESVYKIFNATQILLTFLKK